MYFAMKLSGNQIEEWCDFCLQERSTANKSPFEEHIRVYEEVFRVKALPPFLPLWYPEKMIDLRSTNLFSIIEEVQSLPSFKPYWERRNAEESLYMILHRWSVEKRADFWSYVIHERLKVPFERPPSRILAFPQQDIAQPCWLEDAQWNVIQLIFRHSSEKVALVYQRETGEVEEWTYEALEREVKRLASALRKNGITEGMRIAICMPMRPEAVFLYLAALYIGASAVTIPDSLSGEEIFTRLSISQPQLLFIQDGIYRE
ncbi:MAG: AMP-binding protein, partial [Bacteroidia bacterium]|nr:AMP-binding protein [Bacteroidia bacterium]MDW8134980.1 AMP-binding protein [Bacteroidia bacterium]